MSVGGSWRLPKAAEGGGCRRSVGAGSSTSKKQRWTRLQNRRRVAGAEGEAPSFDGRRGRLGQIPLDRSQGRKRRRAEIQAHTKAAVTRRQDAVGHYSLGLERRAVPRLSGQAREILNAVPSGGLMSVTTEAPLLPMSRVWCGTFRPSGSNRVAWVRNACRSCERRSEITTLLKLMTGATRAGRSG